MALDLTRVASQVGNLLTRLKESLGERREHLRFALDTAHAQAENIDSLRKKLITSKTTWLVADIVDGIDGCFPVPSCPSDFSVLATDGSHIDVDRHRAARCYLINIGKVMLTYGSQPDAVLESEPSLYVSDEDLVISEPGTNREVFVEGTLLGLKRGVDEMRGLVDLAENRPEGSSSVALVDGTLIQFGFSTGGYPDFVIDKLLTRGYIACLDRLKAMNAEKRMALASYISLPRGQDVVNLLKVAVCPNNPLNTDVHCLTCQTRECGNLSGVRDRDLFSGLLGDGERSNLFVTRSSIVEKKYGEHAIYFYYLNVDEEIARVEIPYWVAKNEELLNLTHTLVIDQCRRGQGYPVALAESHELAVVTGKDRDNFWQLVDSAMTEEHFDTSTSAKSRSKITRFV